jgi:lipoprotein NlpD
LNSRHAFWICCLFTILFGCSAQPARQQGAIYYRVQRGDTLYSIAWRYALDFEQVAQLNNLDANAPIYPGQVLVLQAPRGTRRTGSGNVPARASKAVTPRPATASAPASAPIDEPVEFHWATEGEVVARFVPGRLDHQGIDIAGSLGQPVRAASAGKVVYSGNGLPDYGNLVIIKHNSAYLSAYAHNDRVYVKEGAYVKSGQRIADMGQTGTDRPILHFQIRKNGHPVDPLKYLPKR